VHLVGFTIEMELSVQCHVPFALPMIKYPLPLNKMLTFILCLVTLNIQWGMLQRMNATMNVEEYHRLM